MASRHTADRGLAGAATVFRSRCPALGGTVTVREQQEAPVVVRTGEQFGIPVRYSAGTGYSWSVASVPDCVWFIGQEVSVDMPMKPGGGITTTFVFRAASTPCQGYIVLRFGRPWDSSTWVNHVYPLHAEPETETETDTDDEEYHLDDGYQVVVGIGTAKSRFTGAP
jgi:predicted secreted protein